MKHVYLSVAVLTIGLALSVPALAAHPNLDAEAIRAQQAQIRAEAEAGKGPYGKLNEARRQQLFAKQEIAQQLIRNVRQTTELNEREQIELFNALEAIEALVNNDAAERMVCERVRPVGSNRPKTVCMTAAAREDAREAAQRGISQRDQRPVPGF